MLFLNDYIVVSNEIKCFAKIQIRKRYSKTRFSELMFQIFVTIKNYFVFHLICFILCQVSIDRFRKFGVIVYCS